MHKTIRVRLGGGRRVRIDEEMAPLVRALNRCGITTSSSCQASCCGWCGKEHRVAVGRDGVPTVSRCSDVAFLSFPSDAHARGFLDALASQSCDDDLCDRFYGLGPRSGWRWSIHFEEDFNNVMCVFPRTQLQAVTSRILRWADAQ